MYQLKTFFILTVMIVVCVHALAQQKIISAEECKFIQHDPIQLFDVDSIANFDGQKIAVKDLDDDDMYCSVLNFPYPIHSIWDNILENEKRACFEINCLFSCYCHFYKALINSDTVLINSPEKFREIFTPVDSERKALAFASIFTHAKPIYNLRFLIPQPKPNPTEYCVDSLKNEIVPILQELTVTTREEDWVIYQPIITSSYVNKIEDGYEVLLYEYTGLCPPHPYFELLVKVYTNGKVEIIKRQKAFEDKNDRICV
jgi:hypothetical protein